MNTGGVNIQTLMTKNVEDFVDPLTGEVNATLLAEWACSEVDGYDSSGDIPDKFFDWAYVVGERHEIKTGVKEGSMAALSGFINSLPSDCF